MLEQTATGNPALSAKGKGSKRKLGPEPRKNLNRFSNMDTGGGHCRAY